MTLGLRDDPRAIESYRAYHRNVWPEVLQALRAIGIVEMRIFLHGRRLFMYFTAPDDFDPGRDFARYSLSPRAREWDTLMRQLQEPIPGAARGEWWAPMEEVFNIHW